MYISAMPPPSPTPDVEKSRILEKVLDMSRGNRTEAFRYLEHIKKVVNDPDTPRIGVRPLDCFVSG
jgi:hypothetical protein